MSKKETYVCYIIYTDFSFESKEISKISIDANDNLNTRVISFDIIETYSTNFNFSDIRYIVLDVPNMSMVIRKIFEVEFFGYKQTYEYGRAYSLFNISFNIKNLEIEVDDDFLDIKSLIRDIKIKNL
jgi:hypothetical protein